MRTNTDCLLHVVTHYNLQDFTDGRCNFGNYSLFDYPPIADIFGTESLLMNVRTKGVNKPTFPRLPFQAKGDEIVPFAPVQQYVDQQCAHGANVQFAPLDVDDHVGPFVFSFFSSSFSSSSYGLIRTEHSPKPKPVFHWFQTIGEIVGAPGALNFVRQAFEGQAPKVQCCTAHNFLPLNHLNALDIDRQIGKPTADALRSLNGTMSKSSPTPRSRKTRGMVSVL